MPDNPLTTVDDEAEAEVDVPLDDDVLGAVIEEQEIPPLTGLYAQYFAVGLVYGALPGTLYGFFMGYLDVESHVYATAIEVVSLPWSFKFLYGAMNDCAPLGGSHRRSYMVLGWTLCAVALLALATTETPAAGDKDVAGTFAAKMALAAVGYVMADVAADGLVVQFAKMEPTRIRGTIQSNVYLVRTIGSIGAALLVGLGMNGKEYNGTFEHTLTFGQICFILAIPSTLMAAVSWVWIEEPPAQAATTGREYMRGCFKMLRSKAMYYVVVYSIAHGTLGSISTTAGPNVTKIWAGVHTLQAQLFGVLAMLIFAIGLYAVKRHFLNASWRLVIAVTTILITSVDAFFVYCTIYDVVRNQYFYLGEAAVVMVPAAARFMVTTFVVVEMAPDGKEGITYGLLTTLHNLGSPVARGISNALFGTAFSGLSNANNYVEDTPDFRNQVALSYGVCYLCSFVALGLLMYLPNQKAQAQERIEHWPKCKKYARNTIAIVAIAWTYAIVTNAMAMFPSTSCMPIIGGSGC
jgi:hypothetical protein